MFLIWDKSYGLWQTVLSAKLTFYVCFFFLSFKRRGKDAVKFIEKLVVGDIASLKLGEAKLSLIMNESGGIVDDTVISNYGDYIYMVVNGACKVTHSIIMVSWS